MRRRLTAGCGAAALLLAACTIEDASDRRVADSLAAATAKTPPGNVSATYAGGTGATNASTTNARTPSATGPAADSATLNGSLSPDSVDVGRTMTTDSLPATSERLDVDLAARRVTLLEDDRQLASYPIAVGTSKWPSTPGEWSVTQVIWNPEWIPPKDEAWAESAERKAPGAPDNPLGRVQLVYDPPRTIHGTNEPASIGKAASHGSIRMHDADAVKLARQVMEAAGVQKDDAWFRDVQKHRTEKVVVNLPKRVRITVH
ncbi:MAG TPA: L,D-transpeptidase family protein [Gemmatimonadaceae bacterium]|nr:L,D-transpeptidase family protein [Gemmatimonadaceae bacterium]